MGARKNSFYFLKTFCSKLTDAAEKVFGFPCDVTGCSRTDAGVHALGFCCTVAPKENRGENWFSIPASKVHRAFAPNLPNDISVVAAAEVADDFHPRYDVKYKEYVYRIYNSSTRSPLESGRAWHIPHLFNDDAIEKMNSAAENFVGKYDFSAFMASGSAVESTVRDVKYAEVTKQGDVIEFKVAADGFLYNMVRIMTGTLVAVGQGKINPEDIERIIESRDRKNAGMTAPAEGLYLNKVVY